MEKVNGIFLLGGDKNGLNFEIEYMNASWQFCEAFFAVNHAIASGEVKVQRGPHGIELCFPDHSSKTIKLPGGVSQVLEVRRPLALGGETIYG